MEWRERARQLCPDHPGTKPILDILRAEYPEEQLSYDMVRSFIRRYRKRKHAAAPTYKSSVAYAGGETTFDKIIEIADGEEITPTLIMRKHNLDPALWEVLSYRNNYWHSQIRGGTRLVMYQSRLTVKPKTDGISLEHIDDFFKRLDREYAPPVLTPPEPKGHMMAEINIADLHLGKLCWRGDTPENYDYKIARNIFRRIVRSICDELLRHPVERILFVWANDFFTVDTITKTTTAGTPQDADIRGPKLFDVGAEMLIDALEMCAKLGAPVETFWTPSNHDEMTGYHALKVLEAWFRKDPRVKIDTGAQPRRYLRYGNTLLGFAHGDKEKSKGTKYRASELAAAMPIEARELWADTIFREMHAGHLHSEHMIEEINGVIIRRIASPTATDTWHNQNAYIGAVRKAQTFLYDREHGLIHTINTPV